MSDTGAIHTDKLMARVQSKPLNTAFMAIFSTVVKHNEMLTRSGDVNFPKANNWEYHISVGYNMIQDAKYSRLFGMWVPKYRESIFL